MAAEKEIAFFIGMASVRLYRLKLMVLHPWTQRQKVFIKGHCVKKIKKHMNLGEISSSGRDKEELEGRV